MRVTLPALMIYSMTGCSTLHKNCDEVFVPDVHIVYRLPKLPRVRIVRDSNGSLNRDEVRKAYTLIHELREVENYYWSNTLSMPDGKSGVLK